MPLRLSLIKMSSLLIQARSAFLKHVDNRGVSDKELSELLARNQLIPVVDGTTFDDVRRVSPLRDSPNGLDTAEDSMRVIAIKIAELVKL